MLEILKTFQSLVTEARSAFQLDTSYSVLIAQQATVQLARSARADSDC